MGSDDLIWRKMTSLTIVVDLDAIVVNTHKKWLRLYNKDFDDSLTVAQVTVYDMSKVVKPEAKKVIFDYINMDDFFDDLEPLDGAVETLRGWEQNGHDIVIASTPAPNPLSAAKKLIWVKEYLGINRKQVMLGHLKHMLKADAFIDDCPANIESYRQAWPNSHILTIRYPYNCEMSGFVDLMADSWENTAQAWSQIDDYVGTLAKSGI